MFPRDVDADETPEGDAPSAVGTGEGCGEHLCLRGGEGPVPWCKLQLYLSGVVIGVLLLALLPLKPFMWSFWTVCEVAKST